MCLCIPSKQTCNEADLAYVHYRWSQWWGQHAPRRCMRQGDRKTLDDEGQRQKEEDDQRCLVLVMRIRCWPARRTGGGIVG